MLSEQNRQITSSPNQTDRQLNNISYIVLVDSEQNIFSPRMRSLTKNFYRNKSCWF